MEEFKLGLREMQRLWWRPKLWYGVPEEEEYQYYYAILSFTWSFITQITYKKTKQLIKMKVINYK